MKRRSSKSKGAGVGGVASAIRDAMARRNLSRKQLAALARISVSTLNKGFTNERSFSEASLSRIEAVLAIPLLARTPQQTATLWHADDSVGGYSRSRASDFEGSFLTLRPAFDASGAITAYRTVIEWGVRSQLMFTEYDRADSKHSQRGIVMMPHQTGLVYLQTSENGQQRLAILRPTVDGGLYGILLCLHAGRGGQHTPIACPYVLLRQSAHHRFGLVKPTAAAFKEYREHLSAVTSDAFARLLVIAA